MLKVENVSLIYDMDKEIKTHALRNINLSLKENKFYGILGPSGSGKSSLLYTMSALKKPTEGNIVYNNKVLNTLPNDKLAEIRQKDFGFIFQKHFLIDYLSVLQNVLVPINSSEKKHVAKAVELLESLGLKNHINKKPYQLSGGQCQRVAIARALINSPKVIFADEITASLDHKSSREVMKVLDEYRKNATLIVVTHDPSILHTAHEIINVWDGEIRSIDETREAI